jgi:hypothetical protein
MGLAVDRAALHHRHGSNDLFSAYQLGFALPALGMPGGWVADKVMALVGVWGITGVNYLGVKAGPRVSTFC